MSLACLVLGACGGGGGGAPAEPPASTLATDTDPGVGEVGVPVAPDADVQDPGTAPEVPPGAALRIDVMRCQTVGETFELAVDLEPPPPAEGAAVGESTDVSASVTLVQSLGDGLELLSQGDGGISLRMNRRNIVALRADVADPAMGEASDGPTAGRTVYIGGFAADAPSSALMTKPVAGGCLYALRLPDAGFCGTVIARGGRASLGTGDTVVEIDGCEVEAPDGVTVIELPAE